MLYQWSAKYVPRCREVNSGFRGLGQETARLQARHVQRASFLHFLRKGAGGFQARYLQSASCVHFEIENNNRNRVNSQTLSPGDINSYGKDRKGLNPI